MLFRSVSGVRIPLSPPLCILPPDQQIENSFAGKVRRALTGGTAPEGCGDCRSPAFGWDQHHRGEVGSSASTLQGPSAGHRVTVSLAYNTGSGGRQSYPPEVSHASVQPSPRIRGHPVVRRWKWLSASTIECVGSPYSYFSLLKSTPPGYYK